jgi:hypothetical protein
MPGGALCCCSVHKPKFDCTALAQAPPTPKTCKAPDDDFNIVAKQSEKLHAGPCSLLILADDKLEMIEIRGSNHVRDL